MFLANLMPENPLESSTGPMYRLLPGVPLRPTLYTAKLAKNKMKFSVLLSTLLFLGLAQFSLASTQVTYSGAGVQNSAVSGTTDFNFSSLSANYNASTVNAGGIGQFSGLAIDTAGPFGGAAGNSSYGVVGYPGNGSATLTFSGPASYLGFWWSAADAQNTLTLYSGDTAVLTLTGSDLANALGSCGAGSANPYCGNPNNGEDGGELFTYVNIFGTDGTQFSSASFSNGRSTGFEFDNLAYIDPPAVPEPATWSCLALGLSALAFLKFRNSRA